MLATWVKTLYKIWLVGRTNPYNVNPNQVKRLKRVEKFHVLKSQPMLSEASRTERREPFCFPSRIYASPMWMVSTPGKTFFARLPTAVFVDKRLDPGFGPGQKILKWLPVNTLSPNINMYILFTALHMFLTVLFERICPNSKIFSQSWSFHSFSLAGHLIWQ